MSALASLERFGEEYLVFKLMIVQTLFTKRMAFKTPSKILKHTLKLSRLYIPKSLFKMVDF